MTTRDATLPKSVRADDARLRLGVLWFCMLGIVTCGVFCIAAPFMLADSTPVVLATVMVAFGAIIAVEAIKCAIRETKMVFPL